MDGKAGNVARRQGVHILGLLPYVSDTPKEYNLALFKAQLGEAFLEILIFFLQFFVFVFRLFLAAKPSLEPPKPALKRAKPALKCRNRQLREGLGEQSLK